MFNTDIDLANLTGHISYMFKATIGLDPLGNFSAIEGLGYDVEPYKYNELGRNHSPVMLPFDGPGQPGELTLRWGMIIRSKLFSWMDDVRAGGDFRKNVYIFQLSQLKLPFRVYHLTGAWPKHWESSSMTSESQAEMASEQLTLVYDQLDMFNLAAVAMAGQLLASPVSELLASTRPPGYRPKGAGTDLRNTKIKYVEGKPVGPEPNPITPDSPYEADRGSAGNADFEYVDDYVGVAGDVERDIREAEALDEIGGADTKNTEIEKAEGVDEIGGADTENKAIEGVEAKPSESENAASTDDERSTESAKGEQGTDGARGTAGEDKSEEERAADDEKDAEEAVDRRSRDAEPGSSED